MRPNKKELAHCLNKKAARLKRAAFFMAIFQSNTYFKITLIYL